MKIRNIASKYYLRAGAVVGTVMLSVPAFATSGGGGVDYSEITGSVDWGSVALGITGILAALVLPKVALKGGRMLLSAIR